MRVSIEEIGDRGLELDRELTTGFLAAALEGGEGPATDYRPAGPARLKARLDKVSGSEDVLLHAFTRVALVGPCKRCLSEARFEVPIDFRLSLVARPAAASGAGADDQAAESERGPHHDLEGAAASFDVESVEEEPFNGHVIDLEPIVREQLLLALPMDVLCREACKGLCSVCGRDLNEGECGCERKPTDPRWEALKAIKLN